VFASASVRVNAVDLRVPPSEKRSVSAARQSESIDVEASVERCVEVLLDFERYPEWSGPIVATQVLERDDQGRGRRVAFTLDMKIRKIRYTLQYDYQLPGSATWTLVEGDLAGVAGEYRFEPTGPGRTRATCSQEVDLGFWLPGPLRRVFERQALRDSVEDFKRAAEGGGGTD
jgi:hypothetical protein